MFRNQMDQRFATLKVEFDTAAKEKENELLMRENQANQKALAQERRARDLQAIVIVLAIILRGSARDAGRASVAHDAPHAHAGDDGRADRRAEPARGALAAGPAPASRTRLCAMLIIDIDHFKSINDQHGHAEGDEALKLVAASCAGQVREPAFIGRLGGEEFVVVLPGADLDPRIALAERCRDRMYRRSIRAAGLADRRITVSIGLTVSKATGDTPSRCSSELTRRSMRPSALAAIA